MQIWSVQGRPKITDEAVEAVRECYTARTVFEELKGKLDYLIVQCIKQLNCYAYKVQIVVIKTKWLPLPCFADYATEVVDRINLDHNCL